MTVIHSIKKATGRGRRLLEKLSFLAPLATRIVLGLVFVQAGWGKWQHFERTVQYFTGLGIPFPTFNTALVASVELAGGALLIAGLLTRLSALGLSSTMVVALLTAERQSFLAAWSGASDAMPTDVTAFTFLLFLLWLLFLGPGKASMDHLLAVCFRNKSCAVPSTGGGE